MSCIHHTSCRVCGSHNLELILDLGEHPPSNSLIHEISSEYFDFKEQIFPLRLFFCQECGLLQLLDIVNPKILFQQDYPYYTGKSSQTMQKHWKDLAEKLGKDLCKDSIVVDIGGNDGTLLSYFSEGITKINVEPSESHWETNYDKGISTFGEFFTPETARKIVDLEGKVDLVLATNVFAHIDDLYTFMAGVKFMIKDTGVFVIEVPHALSLVKDLEYDTIYHEHMSYWSIRPLQMLANNCGFRVISLEKIPTHGGSLRVYLKKEDGWIFPKALTKIYTEEYLVGMYDKDELVKFGANVKKSLMDLEILVEDLFIKGNKIVGYGCPAKANTILNSIPHIAKFIEYMTDTTPEKQGKYTPGTHIPIKSPEEFYKNPPDYAILFPWNYGKEIIEKEKKFLDTGGKFIMPLTSSIVEKSDLC